MHVLDWGGPVTLHGMEVSDGNLMHADLHGAVVIPLEDAANVVEEAQRIMARERILIEAAQRPDFSVEKIKEAQQRMADIH